MSNGQIAVNAIGALALWFLAFAVILGMKFRIIGQEGIASKIVWSVLAAVFAVQAVGILVNTS